MGEGVIGIIAAMEEESRLLGEMLTDSKVFEVAGLVFHEGKLANRVVVIVRSGIGKVNAAMATTLLIMRYKVCAVINTGTAGGIGEGMSVGDIVLGEWLTFHDVDVTAFGYVLGQMAGMPVDYRSDDRLLGVAQVAADGFVAGFSGARVRIGGVVSGDSFILGAEYSKRILGWFPDALAIEMEGAAIAQVCYRFGVPVLVVRAISDLANEEAAMSFEAFLHQAADRSALMVREIVDRFSFE